ncbi:hypothetical protein C8R44DRAFT_890371 [Mycena epipterygia]|nr:hypothetical protein C8R44DRAFT_890371 [Mycena epipterygia]
MPAMPWVEFLNYPEDFLHPKLIVDGILTCPEDMPSADLRAFAECIHRFQAANSTISIFNDENIISAAMLDRQARADAAKPEEIMELINGDDVDDHVEMHSDVSGNFTPLTSPTSSPRILPVNPINPVPVASSLLLPVQPTPPPTIPQKRKASSPPPSADVELLQPASLRRSSRHNAVLIPCTNAKAVAPNKRHKTRG